MLNEGLATMAVGMGTVFFFLIILWAVVFCLGKVIALLCKIFPEETNAVVNAVKTVCNDSEIAIAIAAAKMKK